MKIRNFIPFIIITIFMLGCTANKAPIKPKEPTIAKFSFFNTHLKCQSIYVCQEIKGKEETKRRAKKAHNYFSNSHNNYSKNHLKSFENNSSKSATEAVLELRKYAMKLNDELEVKYNCRFVKLVK